jgi:hypothetical protein
MTSDRARLAGASRLALVLAVMAGLVWVLPAQAGPAAPAPTVTITTEPALASTLPTFHAIWTIDRPGVMATLKVEGDVLVHTTVVATWTSPPHLIKHNQGSGGIINQWSVTQAPVGAQSHQTVSVRMTRLRGGWGPWSDATPESPYVSPPVVPMQDPPYVGRVASGEARDFGNSGPTLPRGQVQYRLVLTLEPSTHFNRHSWNVAG